MAEFGAHMTAVSSNMPSLFDLVAQDSLMDSILPAINHTLKVISETNPRKYGWCFQYADEIYGFVHTFIQHHYLCHYGGSFSENFYDLKRVPIKSKNPDSFLSFSKRSSLYKKSMLSLVLFPYVKLKLETYYHNLRDQDDLPNNSSKKILLKKAFLKIWPILHFVWGITTLIYFLRYLVGKQRYHSPLLHLCGLTLFNLTEEDNERIEEKSNKLISYSNVRKPSDVVRWIVENISFVMKNSLEVGAFFLQFLEWFYSSNSVGSHVELFSSSSIPKPPHEEYSSVMKLDSSLCPLCTKKRKNDTVLSVSGYVFCYSCILEHIREHECCPVTRYPATTKQLVKLYTQ